MRKVEPLIYATPGGRRSLMALGVVSLAVALLIAIVCEKILVAEHSELLQVGLDKRHRGAAYEDEFRLRRIAAIGVSSVAAIEIGVSGLLGVAAVALLRSDLRGVFLHRAYAILQILTGLVMSVILMSVISDSPAGMLFVLGSV